MRMNHTLTRLRSTHGSRMEVYAAQLFAAPGVTLYAQRSERGKPGQSAIWHAGGVVSGATLRGVLRLNHGISHSRYNPFYINSLKIRCVGIL